MKPIHTFLFFAVILLIMFGFQNRMRFNANWLAKTIEIPSVEPQLVGMFVAAGADLQSAPTD